MTTTNAASSLLGWVWGHGPNFLAALKKAVDENDTAGIQLGREKLEEMLQQVNPKSDAHDKIEAHKAEITAKIATVVAIQNGKSEDWKVASEKYETFADRLSSCASGCGFTEDIAAVMFRCDAENAASYAALCMAKAKGDTPAAHKEVLPTEAEQLVNRLGPSLGCDFTYGARYPQGRRDVCAVRRLAENGSTYGYDTIYLIWKDAEGKLQHRKLADSSRTKDYLDISEIVANGDEVTVKYGTSGSFSGKPWEKMTGTKI